MKSKKLVDGVILFSFKNRREMTLSFCRMQEYYESPNKRLFRKKFTMAEFLTESIKENGKIDYFSYWSGFNVPGNIVNDWWILHGPDVSAEEQAIFNELQRHKIDFSKPFYIIGALEGDKGVVKHEIAHGLSAPNISSKAEMMSLNFSLLNQELKLFHKMEKKLLKMGYNEEVVDDEIQAYLSSETPKYLLDVFGVDIKGVKPIAEMRKILKEYNNLQ